MISRTSIKPEELSHSSNSYLENINSALAGGERILGVHLQMLQSLHLRIILRNSEGQISFLGL
jgi:hypothetical protein